MNKKECFLPFMVMCTTSIAAALNTFIIVFLYLWVLPQVNQSVSEAKTNREIGIDIQKLLILNTDITFELKKLGTDQKFDNKEHFQIIKSDQEEITKKLDIIIRSK